MNPKNVAKELLDNFKDKKSANLCVDYIIKEINKHDYPDVSYILEWETVKQEINNL